MPRDLLADQRTIKRRRKVLPGASNGRWLAKPPQGTLEAAPSHPVRCAVVGPLLQLRRAQRRGYSFFLLVPVPLGFYQLGADVSRAHQDGPLDRRKFHRTARRRSSNADQ